MSLADQLLKDLNDSEEDYEFEANEVIKKELVDESEMNGSAVAATATATAKDSSQLKMKIESSDYNSVSEVAKLKNSERLHSILNKIEGLRNPNLDSGPNAKRLESSTKNERNEYEQTVVVEANNLAADIDDELITIYRFTRTKYHKRFPELESLVVAPIDYILTVRELGNDLNQAKNNENLQKFLTQATIMVVSMTASTTQGVRLSGIEMAQIDEACQMAVELNEIKEMVLEYVASKMSLVAPNLSAIVGPSVAAKLISVEGGLTKLTTTPACNILLIGKEKKNLSGFSKITVLPHTGYIYYCDIVQKAPPELRRKAARYVANKCAIAVRLDKFSKDLNSAKGEAYREEILKKLDKLQEPPPVKFVKPLPKPIEAPKKRRGGKRVRKMKERYAVTELRKNANRLNFADIDGDAYQEDLSYDRGTIGKATNGRIRMPQIDKKTKVRISKTLQKNLQKEQAWGGGVTSIRKTTATAGTASSISFTPLQGFEIVNPQAAEKKFEANNKYFSTTSTFACAKK